VAVQREVLVMVLLPPHPLVLVDSVGPWCDLSLAVLVRSSQESGSY
jgi:hypothetical protein